METLVILLLLLLCVLAATGVHQMMNNPFAHKGYVEVNGELVKAPTTNQAVSSFQQLQRVSFSRVCSKDEQLLNKTEKAYLGVLRVKNPPFIGIQNITLKLADDCRLTPDFNYLDENGRLVFVDVKGFQREDALIKMKVAAREFPIFDFVIVKKDGLGWAATKINP